MKVVSSSDLRTGRIYRPETFLTLVFIRSSVDARAIVSPEGLNQWKIPLTSSGIESEGAERKELYHVSYVGTLGKKPFVKIG